MLTKRRKDKGRAEVARSLTSEEARDLTAALEERDATIAALEQTLAERQEQVAALREGLEQTKFKIKILEQSYSTQLGVARERAAAAEATVAEQQARLTELEASHEKLSKELEKAQAALHSAQPDTAVSIDEMLASFSAPRKHVLPHDSAGDAEAPLDPQAVDEMLAPDVMFAGKGK